MGNVGQETTNHNELEIIIKRIKAQGDNISEYQKALLKWHKNVDKRYAWVVLAALWFMMTAVLGPYRIYSLIYARVTKEGIYSREEASWPVSMIFTVENLIGPFVSIICYHLTYHQSMLIGGVLLAAANGFCAFSSNIYVDIILLGVVQGIGYAFIFMPFMEMINSYFIKYRNSALGFALCGGTLSIFVWSPIFQWILDTYPWRYAYVGTGLVCCIIILMVPFFKSNPMPKIVTNECRSNNGINQDGKLKGNLSRMSVRALTYQNSLRRQSTILIVRQASTNRMQRQASVISVNPFASSAGIERKISRAIGTQQRQQNLVDKSGLIKQDSCIINQSQNPMQSELEYETMSLSEVGQDTDFDTSIIWNVLKTPAFHLIWYNELIYYWIFSIYCLVMVDYAVDRGCTKDESESMLSFQSIGELFGRLILTVLVDMKLLSNKNVVVLVLFVLAGLLTTSTCVTGYVWMASLTVAVSSFVSLLYILLNGLLVDYLGERQVTIGYGMASCIGSFLIFFRPYAVGFCRDHLGSYDPLMNALALSCLVGAVLWIIEPLITRTFQKDKSTLSKQVSLVSRASDATTNQHPMV